ncbi:CLOCK-interacting pacemaker [Festucalex cinctus]
MVKEELVLGECSSHPASSKNAKDKSNSSTLRAMRETKDSDDCSERGFRCSSEKDSGYSDNCSDWQQTDADRQSNKNQTQAAADVTSGPSQDGGKGNAGNPKRMPSVQAIQPIYILNNIMFKRPQTIPKSGHLLWPHVSSEAPGSAGAHMIFFPQPSLMPTTLHKPSSHKNSTAGKKVLPVLNSYPRIAPHPIKKPPDKSLLSDEAQNLSKRVCTEHKGDLEPVATSQQLATSALDQPSSSSSSSSSSSPTQESSNSAPCSPSASAPTSRPPPRSGSGRHRRFHNTVEILRQSGLLDITLRTKELLRQSNATEREIAELRRHAELLCQAADGGSPSWQSVYRTMAESNYYPDLQNLTCLKSPTHRESVDHLEIAGKEATRRSDPSGLLSTTPRQNCSRVEPRREFSSSETSPEVVFTPPDSSTG